MEKDVAKQAGNKHSHRRVQVFRRLLNIATVIFPQFEAITLCFNALFV